MNAHKRALSLALGSLCLLLSSCNFSPRSQLYACEEDVDCPADRTCENGWCVSERTPDASPDAIPDAIPDAVPDAIPDAIPDAMPDAIPDAMPDAMPDADQRPPHAEPAIDRVLARRLAAHVSPPMWSMARPGDGLVSSVRRWAATRCAS